MKHLKNKLFIHDYHKHHVILFIVAIIASLILLFPLYWIFSSSLKSDMEIFKNPPTLFPGGISWDAYKGLLIGRESVLGTAKNSLIIALGAMSISFVVAVPAAYGISRFKIPGIRWIIMLFLVTQMLPSSLLLTPMFLTFSKLKVLNTYVAPILSVTTITIPFTVMVLRPMFMSCPKELEEAAKIDGCNTITAFLRVVLPVIRPGLITVCCFGFVHGWNDLVYSLTFNTKIKLFPMTSTIYNLMNEYGVRWNWIMAYGCLVVLPPTLIFIFAQKYVISGLTSGSVKG